MSFKQIKFIHKFIISCLNDILKIDLQVDVILNIYDKVHSFRKFYKHSTGLLFLSIPGRVSPIKSSLKI